MITVQNKLNMQKLHISHAKEVIVVWIATRNKLLHIGFGADMFVKLVSSRAYTLFRGKQKCLRRSGKVYAFRRATDDVCCSFKFNTWFTSGRNTSLWEEAKWRESKE